MSNKLPVEEHYKKYLKSLKEAKEVLVEAKKMSDSLNLEMQFVEASFTFDHKQLIINFELFVKTHIKSKKQYKIINKIIISDKFNFCKNKYSSFRL